MEDVKRKIRSMVLEVEQKVRDHIVVESGECI